MTGQRASGRGAPSSGAPPHDQASRCVPYARAAAGGRGGGGGGEVRGVRLPQPAPQRMPRRYRRRRCHRRGSPPPLRSPHTATAGALRRGRGWKVRALPWVAWLGRGERGHKGGREREAEYTKVGDGGTLCWAPPPPPQDQSARQLAPFPSPQPPLRRRSALFHRFYLPLRHPPLPPSHTPWHGISPSGCGASPSGWPPARAARPLPRGAPPPPPRARGRHYRSCRRRHFRCRRAPPCQASARRQPPRGATTHPRRRQRDRPPVWRRRRPRGCPPQRRC